MTYSDAAALRHSTGVQHGDLGFDTDAALDGWLDDRLDEVTSFINAYTRRDFEDTDEYPEVPAGISGIARDMGRNLVAVAIAARQSPIVRIDDWTVQIAAPEIFSAKHRKALDLYRKPNTFIMFRVGAASEDAS